MRLFIKSGIFCFTLLVILFFPAEFNFFPWQKEISLTLFSGIVTLVSKNIFGYNLLHCDFSSDSVSMYVLFFVLMLVAAMFAGIVTFTRLKNKKNSLIAFIRAVATVYLALILFRYGFNKIFKWQFYQPEPNTLYTPLGNLDKDILYWSAMGTSYWYSIFAGLIEIIPAVLILFRKTKIAGLLIALAVFSNILAINIGFDISVKLFSAFLIFVTLVLLKPQFWALYDFLIHQKKTSLQTETKFVLFNHERLHRALKPLLVALCLCESLYPYLSTMNFNDDKAPRPFLHGAYVPISGINISFQGPQGGTYLSIKRFFIHRQGYFIAEDFYGIMHNFRMQVDAPRHMLRLTGNKNEKIDFVYNIPQDSLLTLTYTNYNSVMEFQTKMINWKKLPAINDQFHWTVDEYGK
ncbi:MAG TPA: hypothetical protein VD905_12070 [Flavobacteriales bacterium]|nr:hypothetical protein [Flavobacteriales bacterium]